MTLPSGVPRTAPACIRRSLSCAPAGRRHPQKLVGEDASPTEIALARAAAEAQFDLRRVRQHREALLALLMREVAADRVLQDDHDETRIPNLIGCLDRYERRAICHRERALDNLSRLIRLPVLS
jgi:hypothetical protein